MKEKVVKITREILWIISLINMVMVAYDYWAGNALSMIANATGSLYTMLWFVILEIVSRDNRNRGNM